MQILRYLGYFNPRPLRGGRLGYTFLTLFYSGVISIHALYEEGDMILFLTPSKPSISIHALYEEGDDDIKERNYSPAISIHALYEEGDTIFSYADRKQYLFQSTPSTRRATARYTIADNYHSIFCVWQIINSLILSGFSSKMLTIRCEPIKQLMFTNGSHLYYTIKSPSTSILGLTPIWITFCE